MIEGATFPAIHHLGYKKNLQDGNIDAFARNVSQVNRWSEVPGANNSERLFEVLIRYKEHTDLEMQMVKRYDADLLYCISLSKGNSKPKEAVSTPIVLVIPNALHETCEKESLYAVNPEVVEVLLMISTFL